jgi:hypothetical protein
MVSFSLNVSASAPLPPNGYTLKTNYVIYQNDSGFWRMVTSNNPIYLIYDSSQNQTTFSASKTTCLLDSYMTIYGYNTTTNKWDLWTGTYLNLNTFYPSVYYSNLNVSRYNINTGTLNQNNFFPIVRFPLTQIVYLGGGQILQGASQISSIVLVTGLIILAVLLGILLIPRVVHSFH